MPTRPTAAAPAAVENINEGVPEDILALVQKRADAKKAKDFASADAIRAELKALGWVVEDSAAGPRVYKG